ncbi:hypothetical protein RN001_004132 [Aquatica leii]|uniref:Uncharacterized protein n=1 Tax=Aquatica leii TaxID=1421715 RepID=A0AAN7PPS1_9COLE|nr:hypothetical protein RN001_004132 [Aquatica leii]
MVDPETFVSVNRKTYKWPYSKPLSPKPTQPSVATKSKNQFVKGPVDAYCHCDGHTYDPLLNRYLKLSEKEKLLHEELMTLNNEMADLNTEILEHECDTYDDKMETTYQIDYAKRGMTPATYVKLMPAVDSPAGVPVKSPTLGLGKGYRDPSRFTYSPFPRPTIDSILQSLVQLFLQRLRPVDRLADEVPEGDLWIIRRPIEDDEGGVGLAAAEEAVHSMLRRRLWSTYQVEYCKACNIRQLAFSCIHTTYFSGT